MSGYNKQIIRKLNKGFEAIDFKGIAELKCQNEAQTRQMLIEPFFELLGYNYREDLVPEYNADFGNRESKKVDYAIIINGNNPQMIIEAKKYGKNLNDKDAGQLNDYFVNTNSAKIGILTNGMIYKFYARDSNSKGLNPNPFFEFNIEDYDNGSIGMLSLFFRNSIDIKMILEEAQSVYFLDEFENAFFQELTSPSPEFIKSIYNRMGGKRINDKVSTEIRSLINSISISTALDNVRIHEAKMSKSGIITTNEELKIFHVIKTILAQNKQIETHRIEYKDYKNFFNILIDGNQRKNVCTLTINTKTKNIDIQGQKFEINDIDSIVNLRKKLIESALTHINQC